MFKDIKNCVKKDIKKLIHIIVIKKMIKYTENKNKNLLITFFKKNVLTC